MPVTDARSLSPRHRSRRAAGGPVSATLLALALAACDPPVPGVPAPDENPGATADAKARTAVSAEAPDAELTPATPQVVAWSDAPRKDAPNGKGHLRELVRGREAYLAHLVLDPGAAVPEHQDETEEFLHVISGGGTLYIDGERHQIAAGASVYMPAMATVSFENGEHPLVALQVFADPGPEKKYEAWTAVTAGTSPAEGRCRKLAARHCEPAPARADAEAGAPAGPDLPFARMSIERQQAWVDACVDQIDQLDDEQIAQFDRCVGCVSQCREATGCLAGDPLCDR